MVVNELLTNAVKYAYGPDQAGVVKVRLIHDQHGVVLSVADAGVGLPGGAAWTSTGLGMRLVRSLVAQANGRLEIRREAGALFEISLPATVIRS